MIWNGIFVEYFVAMIDAKQKTSGMVAQVMKATGRALEALEEAWDLDMVDAWTQHVLKSQGRVVVSGMGKSGLIGQKISATLASTGCPSFFLHPAEAIHGDLGMVTPKDTVLLLSNSGESEEINRLIPCLVRQGNPIGAITSRPDSSLALAAKWRFLYTLPEGEGCPLNFAPMASTTMQLVWGDLLAAYHMVQTGFTLESFAQFHPGGSLGARLLKAKDLMHKDFPTVAPSTHLISCLGAMSGGKLGMAAVLDNGRMAGVISDGDIRRALEKAQSLSINPLEMKASDVMSSNPKTVDGATMAVEAARLMEERRITFLLVLEDAMPVGVLHIHDLLSAKVI